ncbi:MAG: endonuclease MutS2 [Eubacteriales bacterium]
MNEKTYKALEYAKIIEMLKNEACSDITKAKIIKLKPSVEKKDVQELQEETSQAVGAIFAKGNIPLGNFYDLNDMLAFACKGGILSMGELLQVNYNLCIAGEVIRYFDDDIANVEKIRAIAELLCAFPALESDIDRCIVSETEMADNASSELRTVRRNILRKNEHIRAKLAQIVANSENKTILQDSLVTMRHGRYVIPVKQEHKSKVSGIVHDQSQTGATLFVEPQVIVNLNNELSELKLAEEKEVRRILEMLTKSVVAQHRIITNNQELMVKLDFIFARARLGILMGAFTPQISDESIELNKARHPLLETKNVVPIDITIDKFTKTLIITGPNTGGKTVTLKTLGLFCMMFQSGLQIPASEGSKLPIFRKIFADIGDEQSIEQSLSTFSSHMTNIVNIMKQADSSSLVLFDELGAGTDPQEGASLAIAILKEIMQKSATCVATTHYTELKKFAIETAGVQNASMEFDVETLSPTYRLIIGLPGKSNAFEISKKLGLSENIIDCAKNLLTSGQLEFENVLQSIQEDRKIAAIKREEAIMIGLSMKKKQAELEASKAKFEAKKEKLMEKAKAEALEIIRETEELRENVKAKLKDLDLMDNMVQRNANLLESKRQLEQARGKYREKIAVPENYKPVTADMLRVGDLVKVLSLGQNGNILSLPDNKGELSVQIGNLKVNVTLKNIMLLSQSNKKEISKSQKTKYATLFKEKAGNVSLSINVRGKLLEEALSQVDKYLDDAFIAKLETVTIIHGRGEGILRRGIHEMLAKNKHVKKFRDGHFNEGGNGVTVVSLKI